MIKFSHAQYSTDGASSFTLWYSTDEGRSYHQLGGVINNTSTSFTVDSFKINADFIRFEFRKSGSAKMNIDNITFVGAGNPKIQFNTPQDNPGSGGGSTGGSGGGNVDDVPPTTGDNSNLLFGNPTNSTADVVMAENYLIDQGYYVESYSSSRAIPNWVSWHLDESSLGNAARQDDFRPYTGLPSSFYQVQDNSYSGSGFDRGHNCPSADRTSSVAANSSTFLMTNMIPQAPNNNQQTWSKLEEYLRGEAQKGYEVYIVMGSYGKGGTGNNGSAETINGGKVTVPAHVWKVAVILLNGNSDLSRVTSSTRVLAVDTPNMNSINADWKQYITTVDAIEAATGDDLLSALPTSLQTTLEAKKYIP
jgi:endonuclease G